MTLTMADQIRAYRRTGSINAAARELGIPFATLYRRLQAAGIDTTGAHRPLSGLSRRRVSWLCDLYGRGLTQRDLAALSGVTQRSIRLLLIREGVPLRPPHNPGRARMLQRHAVLEEIGRLDLLDTPTDPVPAHPANTDGTHRAPRAEGASA